MIRIGIECESIEGKNPIWGVGRIIVKLLQELAARPELAKEYRFVLYFKDRVPDLECLASPIFDKKLVTVPGFPGRLFPIYYYLLLPLKLWFEQLDVMYWPNYMLPIIAAGKNYVMLTEDVYYEAHRGTLPFRYRLAYGIFGWWSAHRATRLMAISETSREAIATLYHISKDRIITNHLGVDFLKQFHPQLTPDQYVLYVGQAFPRRHLKETLEGFALLAEDFPDVKLIAIGPDKYEAPTIAPAVKEINTHRGREVVIHKEYVSDHELSELYQGARAVVYVSDHEAFGLPPMEALVYGVPPIIADNALGHELFGPYAIYSPKTTPEGISGAIKTALTDVGLRQKIARSGPDHVAQYSWQKFTDRWLTAIRTIAS